jgi:hypothetical protein
MSIRIIKDVYGHKCQLCGKAAELRPYGPNGEWICYECGMKDKATTTKQMAAFMSGEGIRVIDARRSDD